MHVCFVLTTPFVLNAFALPAILALLSRGWRVTVLVNTGASDVVVDIPHDVDIVNLDIRRDIALFRDIRTLWALIGIFRLKKFDIVHSITPKAGLLAMIAARVVGIPVRVHTFTGQVWVTRHGVMRWFLRLLDKVLALCANALLVDSFSQRDFLVNQRVASLDRLAVLGQGSIVGVNTKRFCPNAWGRKEVRSALNIPSHAIILLYLGRMHVEKGVSELVQSFAQLAFKFEQLHLLLVGPDEGALIPALVFADGFRNRIHTIKLTNEPEKYMAASDVFCLASYREGFGLSLIEAASVALPCVASRIYGVTDAVVDGFTGYLVPLRDPQSFAEALSRLIRRSDLREAMGVAARERVEKCFSQDVLVQAWMDFYDLQISLSMQKNRKNISTKY